MTIERTVEFAYHNLFPLISEVEWPKDLPMPIKPHLPQGSKVIEMPNTFHKGLAEGPIGELYHCIKVLNEYKWTLAD
jgi:hypothetical protein